MLTFQNADVRFRIQEQRRLTRFIKEQVKREGHELGDLCYIFCSDAFILELNRKHLNHDYPTDILTFPYSEESKTVSGEIYISVDRVKENAQTYAKGDFTQELHRVIFHGVLHLLGYKDGTKTEKAKMRKMEGEWLNEYFKS